MTKYLAITGIGKEGYHVAVRIEDTHNLVASSITPNLESALVKAYELASTYPIVLSQEISFRPNPQDKDGEETFRASLSSLDKLANRSLLDLYSSLPRE